MSTKITNLVTDTEVRFDIEFVHSGRKYTARIDHADIEKIGCPRAVDAINDYPEILEWALNAQHIAVRGSRASIPIVEFGVALEFAVNGETDHEFEVRTLHEQIAELTRLANASQKRIAELEAMIATRD